MRHEMPVLLSASQAAGAQGTERHAASQQRLLSLQGSTVQMTFKQETSHGQW